jgi:guanylate kinase
MEGRKSNSGKVVVISGPSGVGKSTICREVVKRLSNVYLSVSVTTRPKAEGEVDGREYWFLSQKQFQERINKGLLLEYAEVFGSLYGTPKDKVDEALKAGKVTILEIDVQGGRAVKKICPDAVMIFIMPPVKKELARRISGRGRDKIEAAERRLNIADSEIAVGRKYYRYVVVNDDLQKAINDVVSIIQQNTGGKE